MEPEKYPANQPSGMETAPPPQYAQAVPPQSYPPQGYPPQGQPPPPVGINSTVVVTQGAPVLLGMQYGESPMVMVCPVCRSSISTATSSHVGGLAWLLCVLLFFFGFWLCSFIPFCVPSCKDIVHHCPVCKAELGKLRRL